MSILDKIKGRKKQIPQEKSSYDNCLLEIVRIVSFDDRKVLHQAEKCVANVKDYYREHLNEYEERGINPDEDDSFLQWIGCVDLLIQNHYVWECDWKEEKDVFFSEILHLKEKATPNLNLRSEWLNERWTVPQWCEKLDREWYKEKYVMAAFNIDSDSYVLFVCDVETLGRLTVLAEDFGYQIDFGKNM